MKKRIIQISVLIISAGLLFTTGYLVSKSIHSKENTKSLVEQQPNTTDKQKENELTKEPEEKNDTENNDFIITYKGENYLTQNNQKEPTSVSRRNIPTIENKSNPEIAQKIQKSIIAVSDEKWINDIKSAADEFNAEINNGNLDWENEYEEIGAELELKNSYPIKNILLFNLSLSGSFGGVGWSGFWSYNYDITTGNLLTLKDITTDYNKLYSIIKKEVDTEIKNIESEDEDTLIFDLTDKEMENLISKTGNWMFTNEGIEIVFQKHEISDGATGMIEVSIEKSLINDLLKENYKF